MTEPVFVVVGHVNQGKSSIVSTLTADDSVEIGKNPGTTVETRRFPCRIDDELLYTVFDTPGFERPRQVLNWLKKQAPSTAERPETVRQFVELHRDGNQFHEETQLLLPIVEGGAILYVVDSSKPPSSFVEAEMEILQWTGRPRIALINPTEDQQCLDGWRTLLDQYFNIVRPFNSHQARFTDRLGLLETMRELQDEWRPQVERAIKALQQQRQACLDRSARIIIEMICQMVSHQASQKIPTGGHPNDVKKKLQEDFENQLRRLENQFHERLQQVFQHHRTEVTKEALAPQREDLFGKSTWTRLGLSKRQLIASFTAAGAGIGAVIDASLIALTFGVFTAVGSAAGFATGRLALKGLHNIGQAGDLLLIGPIKHPNFPWILLDRALLIYQAFVDRAHARREDVSLEIAEQSRIVSSWDAKLQASFSRKFKRLASSRLSVAESVKEDLEPMIQQQLDRLGDVD